MPWSREALEPRREVTRDVHVLGGDGERLTVERLQRVAVEAPRRADQLRGVDNVRRADLGDVHLDVRVRAHDVPGCPCVVEVDVREEQMPDLREIDAALELGETRGGPAVEECRPLRRLDAI